MKPLSKAFQLYNETRFFLSLSHYYPSYDRRLDRALDNNVSRARLYLSSAAQSYKAKHLFESIERYCMFIGYPRSGHTLIGALIDAHPNAVIGNELDVLKFIDAGFGRNQIFYLLLENSRAFAQAGRDWTGYSYTVENQWQGKFKEILVIGDKKGGESARRLQNNFNLLEQLQRKLNLDIRMIHTVRNPFDIITTMFVKNKLSLRETIDVFFASCETVQRVKEETDEDEMLDIHYDQFVRDSREGLRIICNFLGLKPDIDYLEDCAGIVYDSPKKSRRKIEWDKESIELVSERIESFPFLAGYTFDT